MINLIYSLGVGLLTAIFFKLTFVESYWALILPFITGGVIAYVLFARKTARELEALMKRVQTEMSKISPQAKPKIREQGIERAIDILKEGFELGKKQFLIDSQLHSQIGMLYYVQQKFKKAQPHLERAFVRDWMSRSMLACLHFKAKEYDKMKEVFEALTNTAKKEALYWNLYAWCVWKSGDREGAQEVLTKGAEALPEDERVKTNLKAVRNKRPIKMRGWREQWYQFHLEAPPQPKMRFDRRSVRGR